MKIREFFIKITSTFFYVGYLPLIPGTFGSLAGVFLLYLVTSSPLTYPLLPLRFSCLGCLVSGQAEKYYKKKDPRYVVIDEVSGMLLALGFLPVYDLKIIIIAFFLFRILDTLKAYPAGRLQEIKGSAGIMSDDLVAGLYTNIILQVVLRFASCKTS